MENKKKQAERNNEILKKICQIQPEKTREYQTEMGISQIFNELFSEHLRFNATAKKWWLWDGIVWREDVGGAYSAEQAKNLYRQLVIYGCKKIESDDVREKFLDCIRKYGNYNKRKTMLEDAKPLMIVTQEDFDCKHNLFNCLNCTLDLDTLESHEHRASDMLSKVSGCNYNPAADGTKWSKFIDEIMQGNKEKSRYFQKIKGYALTAETFLETGFFLYGRTTRNGKTTAEEVYKAMMGDYAATVQPETLERMKFRNGSTPTPDKARLAGVRFATIPEPPQGMVLDVALYKQWTGGNRITARFLNENSFEYKPQFKLFFDCNHLPIVADDTLFASDRVRIITFDRHFEPQEQNKHLKQELQAAEVLSSVLNWALDGLRDLRANGEQPPECVLKATADFEKQSDKILKFFNDCMVAKENINTSGADVYRAYCGWCRDNGYEVEGKTFFNNSLRERGFMRSATVNGKTDRNAVAGYDFIGNVQNV